MKMKRQFSSFWVIVGTMKCNRNEVDSAKSGPSNEYANGRNAREAAEECPGNVARMLLCCCSSKMAKIGMVSVCGPKPPSTWCDDRKKEIDLG